MLSSKLWGLLVMTPEDKARIEAIRVAQKRLAWIQNVKRVFNWDQQKAEEEWTKIFNAKSK